MDVSQIYHEVGFVQLSLPGNELILYLSAETGRGRSQFASVVRTITQLRVSMSRAPCFALRSVTVQLG